jgi:hypothetical protein
MVAAILAVLNMIPGLSNLITSLTAAYFNSKVKLTAARLGADTTVATALLTAAMQSEVSSVDRLKVISGSWVLSFLTVGFSLPYMIYEWQCVVYDKILMHGTTTTDPLGGDISSWSITIIGCLFGSGTVLTAGHMYFNRSKVGE